VNKENMLEPRRLKLATLDSLVAEIERLHQHGYEKAGQWNLSQICEHLADWMSYPMDGFPPTPFAAKLFLGAIRAIRGKSLLHKFIEEQAMPRNQPTIALSVHPATGDEAASIARYRSMVERLTEYRGTIQPSPLFGSMNRAELIGLQLAHGVHHLNFLIPKVSS
jgi:hypothetical protein